MTPETVSPSWFDYRSPNAEILAPRWWAVVLRGAVAILFGFLILSAPGISLLALVTLWGLYAISDGIFDLILGTHQALGHQRSGWFFVEGVFSVLAGVLTLAYPRITAGILLVVIATWAILTGIAKLVAAVNLRKQIRNEWLLGLGGLLSIGFGAFMFLSPAAGALAFVWAIGSYTIAFGIVLIGLGLRLNTWRHHHQTLPTGGMPTAA